MTDARERRRERAATEKPKTDLVGTLKKFRVPIVIVLLWGGFVGYTVASDTDCPGHWHSTVDPFVDMGNGPQRIDLTAPTYSNGQVVNRAYSLDFGTLPMETHLHSSNMVHYEPSSEKCFKLGTVLNRLDLKFLDDALELNGDHNLGRFENNATHHVVYQYKTYDQEWHNVTPGSLANQQIPDGGQIIAAYVPLDYDVAQLQSQTTPFNASPAQSTGSDDIVPIIAVTLIAAVAVWVWWKFASGGMAKK